MALTGSVCVSVPGSFPPWLQRIKGGGVARNEPCGRTVILGRRADPSAATLRRCRTHNDNVGFSGCIAVRARGSKLLPTVFLYSGGVMCVVRVRDPERKRESRLHVRERCSACVCVCARPRACVSVCAYMCACLFACVCDLGVAAAACCRDEGAADAAFWARALKGAGGWDVRRWE